MAQTIPRKAKGVRRQARAQSTKRQVRKARAKSDSLLDAVIKVLPFTQAQLQQFFLVVIFASAVAIAWVIASVSGFTGVVQQQLATYAASAGFEVRRVEVNGVERMNKLAVYSRVLGERDRAMPLVDVHALRRQLLTLPWVEDARVSRQLPDAIVIDIVERQPHAVLRTDEGLVLIDPAGHELEPIAPAKAKGMLQLSGSGAQTQVGGLSHLLDAAPALRPQVVAAEWVGNRRWNVTFKTGQVLALPEGENEAAGALVSFARLDGLNRLLGGKVATFDMRTPERIYMRVPGRLAAAEAETRGS
ncbi:cell division protein FtsQ/DivIB [Altericroceibacterium xinjiangense]|uniref:cell division protein FtsQ/DivIB n=1 Tax=Altericroceibacterium xinjiangense TaxID=762261 RepID=UPI000F7E1719|nr:FtsQ-type POTRA domain-containing protein [Altericroceibacterium xinjiangense]